MTQKMRHVPRLGEDQAAGLLKAHGISPTRQRVQVAAVLLACPQHLSAEQLLRLVNRDGDLVSKATVYNTLGLFVRKGLVRELVVDRARVFYDSNAGDHHHIYDVDDGTLTDLDSGEIAVGGLPPLPAGAELDGVDIIVRIRRKRPRT